MSRNSIANQMKYKNQPNFIPQPKLNMAEISKYNKLQRNKQDSSPSLILNDNNRERMRNGLRKSKSTQQMGVVDNIFKSPNKYESQNS